MPNPGKSPELKRLAGSREPVRVVPVVNNVVVPEPPRRLEESGLRLWNEIWQLNWLNPQSDIEAVALLCERMDERDILRAYVLDNIDAWRERASLRKLEDSIEASMKSLILTPADRVRAGVQTVKVKSKLQELMDLKAAKNG